MSVANTLPLLIIQGIVRQFVVNANQSSDFKDGLKLLTISRSWREFAKPLVYKCVYFSLTSPISSGFNSDMDSKYTRVSAGQTNIGLVKALKVSRLAKSITINITDMSSNADDFIDNAHKFFDYKNCNWQNIRELSIYVRVNTTGTNVIETDARQKNPWLRHMLPS
ncbi:hypothetical protein FB645_004753 [Coemansia sp. IMI 203386]|nr:hypothetical protein FB645_004753 [Coemansia sp. IMI 203386]